MKIVNQKKHMASWLLQHRTNKTHAYLKHTPTIENPVEYSMTGGPSTLSPKSWVKSSAEAKVM